VRFLHGSEDDVIHFSEINKVAEVLKSKYGAVDVSINILQGADHRVSRLDDIAVILDTVDEFL
jgi:dipeptidyl aminopeptidase/acylaminoacyl peptidase